MRCRRHMAFAYNTGRRRGLQRDFGTPVGIGSQGKFLVDPSTVGLLVQEQHRVRIESLKPQTPVAPCSTSFVSFSMCPPLIALLGPESVGSGGHPRGRRRPRAGSARAGPVESRPSSWIVCSRERSPWIRNQCFCRPCVLEALTQALPSPPPPAEARTAYPPRDTLSSRSRVPHAPARGCRHVGRAWPGRGGSAPRAGACRAPQ